MSPQRIRAIAAAILGLAGGLALPISYGPEEASIFLPLAAMIVAAVAVQVPRLPPQLLARGLFWSNLVLGVILCVMGNGRERSAGLVMVLACGSALLVADRRTLASAVSGGGYTPSSFAGTLQLLMVLVLADTQTCLLLGAIEGTAHPRAMAMFLAAAALFVVAFVGLYRLRVWGVMVSMGTALTLAVLMLTRVVDVKRKIQEPMLVLLAVQLLAPLPMVFASATKRRLVELPPRVRSRLAAAAVVLVMAGGVLAFAMH